MSTVDSPLSAQFTYWVRLTDIYARLCVQAVRSPDVHSRLLRSVRSRLLQVGSHSGI